MKNCNFGQKRNFGRKCKKIKICTNIEILDKNENVEILNKNENILNLKKNEKMTFFAKKSSNFGPK